MHILDNFEPKKSFVRSILRYAADHESEHGAVVIKPDSIGLDDDAVGDLIRHGLWLRNAGYTQGTEARGLIAAKLTPDGWDLLAELEQAQ